jgi:hypothetical protein
MITTKLKICNMAIALSGGNPVNSIPDGNKEEGILCDTFWDIALETVLSDHPWKNFKKWVSVESDGTIEYDGNQTAFPPGTLSFAAYNSIDEAYEYAAYLPDNFVRFVDTEDRQTLFARRDRYILSNVDPIEFEYIYKPTIAAYSTALTWDSWFVDALVAQLVFRIGPKLVRKGSKQRDLAREYLAALALAQAKDAKQDRQGQDRGIRHTSSNDNWITSRG